MTPSTALATGSLNGIAWHVHLRLTTAWEEGCSVAAGLFVGNAELRLRPVQSPPGREISEFPQQLGLLSLLK